LLRGYSSKPSALHRLRPCSERGLWHDSDYQNDIKFLPVAYNSEREPLARFSAAEKRKEVKIIAGLKWSSTGHG